MFANVIILIFFSVAFMSPPFVSPLKCRCPLLGALIIHTLLLSNLTRLLFSTTIVLWLSHLDLQPSALLNLYMYTSNFLREISISIGNMSLRGKITPSWKSVVNFDMVICVFPRVTVNFLRASLMSHASLGPSDTAQGLRHTEAVNPTLQFSI